MANNSFCGVGIAYSAKIGGEWRLYLGKLIVIDLVTSVKLVKSAITWKTSNVSTHKLNLEAGIGVES